MAGARAGGDDAFAFSPSFHPRGLKPSLLWYISCQAGRGRSPPWAPASLPRVGVPGLATALGSCRGTCGPKPRPRSPPPVQFSELLLAVWERLLGFALVRGSRAGAADPPVGPEQRHGSAGREEGERPPAVTRTSRPGRGALCAPQTQSRLRSGRAGAGSPRSRDPQSRTRGSFPLNLRPPCQRPLREATHIPLF